MNNITRTLILVVSFTTSNAIFSMGNSHEEQQLRLYIQYHNSKDTDIRVFEKPIKKVGEKIHTINNRYYGWNILHFAAYNYNITAIQALLAAGVSPHTQSLGGKRPLDVARARYTSPNLQKLLEDAMKNNTTTNIQDAQDL
jgi:hypothetical protein